jgi:hypothetical protein
MPRTFFVDQLQATFGFVDCICSWEPPCNEQERADQITAAIRIQKRCQADASCGSIQI